MGQNWAMPEVAQAQQRAVDLIPNGVCVEAADTAVPHLVDRTYVGLHGDIGDGLSSWMIIDTNVEETIRPRLARGLCFHHDQSRRLFAANVAAHGLPGCRRAAG